MNQTAVVLLSFAAAVLLSVRFITRLALDRSTFFGLLWGAVLLLGGLGFSRMPLDLMPEAAGSAVSVFVNVRGGMSPLDVESRIVKPLENTLGEAPGLTDIVSTANNGRAILSLRFRPGSDMARAASDVQERLERAMAELPPETERPVTARYEEGDAPVYIFALSSDSLAVDELRRLADEKLKEGLLRSPGVANVEVGGGRERKILVELDAAKLQVFGLSVQRVSQALGRRNVAVRLGSLSSSGASLPVKLTGNLASMEDVKNIILARSREGGQVLLRQVAEVRDSFMEAESQSRLNGRAAVTLYVQKENGANTLETGARLEKTLEELWAAIPPGLRSQVQRVTISDRAGRVREALAGLRLSVFTGVLLVVAVLGFFYGDLIPAVTVAATIPLSLALALAVLSWTGVSLNAMTLFGLALGVGLLVDNAIVLSEELAARRGDLSDERHSLLETARKVLPPLTASVLTACSALVPFLFLPAEMRALYSEIAVTIAASLFAALWVTFGFIPWVTPLGRRFKASGKPGVLLRAEAWRDRAVAGAAAWFRNIRRRSNAAAAWARMEPRLATLRSFGWVAAVLALAAVALFAGKAGLKILYAGAVLGAGALGAGRFPRYEETLRALLKRRRAFTAWAAATALAAVALIAFGTERDFQMSLDPDQFVVFTELSSGSRLEASDKVVRKIEDVLLSLPEAARSVKAVASRVEGWSSKVYVTLKPLRERADDAARLIALLRPRLRDVGLGVDENAFVHFSTSERGREISLVVYGPEYDVLEGLAQQAAAGLETAGVFSDVKVRYRPGRPEVLARVDPVRAARRGLSAEQVAESLHGLVRGFRATYFRQAGARIETVVRLRREDREALGALPDIPIALPGGGQARLAELADLEMAQAPNEIFRENKERFIEVTGTISKGSWSGAAAKARAALKKIDFPLDYYGDLGREYETASQGFHQLLLGVVVMGALVYLILVVLFESLAYPFIIFTSALFCVVGVALGMTLFGLTLSPGVIVGTMMLGGIVVNNSILWLHEFSGSGGPAPSPEAFLDRLVRAGLKRRRPIALTTACAVLGFAPMAFDATDMGVLWRPLSVTLIFGLLSSVFVTLFVVPCVAHLILRDLPAALATPLHDNEKRPCGAGGTPA